MADYPELKMFIGGAWRGSARGEDVLNPADQSVLGHVPHASRGDLDDALQAASDGLRIWRATAPNRRADIVGEAARLLRERVEIVAKTMRRFVRQPRANARSSRSRSVSSPMGEWREHDAFKRSRASCSRFSKRIACCAKRVPTFSRDALICRIDAGVNGGLGGICIEHGK